MQLLLILLCTIFSCSKVTTQGFLAKGNIKNITDALLANGFVFFFVSLLFSLSMRDGVNMPVLCYAAVFGLLSVSFQVFYSLSFQTGPFAITSMIINLNMIVPVIFSIIYFHETPTVTKVIGVLLALTSLFFNVKSDDKKVNLKWFVYVFLAYFSTAGISITQKLFVRSSVGEHLEQFIFFGYVIAFVLSLFVFFAMRKTEKQRNFQVSKKNLVLVFLIAFFLGAFQFVYTYANAFVDAIVLVPSIGGLAMILQMIPSKFLFHDKFTKRQILGMCIGIVAIVVISL